YFTLPTTPSPASFPPPLPDALPISGDFSGGRTINDPATGQPLPGNRIPANLIDPNAVLLIKTYYRPPTPGFRQGALNFSSTEPRSEEHTSELQSRSDLVCRLLLEKK